MEIGFKGYHPAANILFFASIVVFGMLFRHPATLAVCFIAAVCFYIRLCGKAALKSFLLFLFPMLIFVAAVNGLFAHYGATPLLTLPGGNRLTLESLVYGFVLGLMTVTVIIWFLCYNETVTTDKFMFVFGKILPASALVISMALRFVPMYKSRAKIIADAQKGIGSDHKSGTFTQKIKNAGSILSVLTTWSLENAIDTSDSMKARGYGLRGKKSYGKFRWSKRDVITVVLIILLDAVLVAGCILKPLNCVYSPYIVINRTVDGAEFESWRNITLNPISHFGLITLAAFTVLCFLPLIIDFKEEIKWNRSKSKI